MTKRVRARDEGTVYQRKDGRWVASLRWPDGARKSRYRKTYRAAASALGELRALRAAGTAPPNDQLTVGKWLDTWLKERVSRLSPATQESYRHVVATYIRPRPPLPGPSLDRERLISLQVRRVAAWLDDLLEQGVPAPTAAHSLIVLRTALKAAMREDLIVRNPASLVEAPRWRRRKGKPFTAGEASGLMAAIRSHRLYALVVLALTSAMRRGELIGLTWGAVRLEEATLYVRQQLQRQKGKGIVAVPTKTERSEAPVVLTRLAVQALRGHRGMLKAERLRLGPAWQGSDDPVADDALVFPTGRGTPMDGPAVWGQWKRLLAEAGVEHHRLHDTRHTTSTLLRALGVAPEVAQQILRHAKVTTTLGVYTHVNLAQQREAAAALDQLLGEVLG